LTFSCNCNYGNVDIYEPQCLCSCYPGYLLPNCLYQADDNVTVEIWLTIPPMEFYSDDLVQTLAWALPIRNASVSSSFLYARPYAAYNRTAAFVLLLGDRAQQLVWDFTSENAWLAEAKIEAVWEHVPTLPQSTTYGASLAVYESTDGKILITVEHIMWLIGAVVVLVGLSMLDSCWLGNNEEDVWEYIVEHHAAMTNLVKGDLVPSGAVDSGDEEHIVHEDAPSNPLHRRPRAVAPTSPPAAEVSDPHRIFTDRSRR
jgi:hypothetical protein